MYHSAHPQLRLRFIRKNSQQHDTDSEHFYITSKMNWLPSVARDERVILGFFTAAAVGTAYLMHIMLSDFRDEAEIKPMQPKTQYITQETEDTLKYSTLETLLGHYNYAIRDTACKIVCDRAANDGSTLDVLLWGITRPDYDERMKN